MAWSIDVGPSFQVPAGDGEIAECVFGRAGRMPSLAAQGHTALATAWTRLAAEPGARSVLVRGVGKGFCAGCAPDAVRGTLDREAARLRVTREARALADASPTAVACTKRSLKHGLRAAWPPFGRS